MTDTFLKTLQTVVVGSRQLEEFAGVLVSSAVEDALLCVARDYGLDYAALLRRYREEVVRRHASGALGQKTQCRGTTKGGKQCGKRAQLHGYCAQHAAQMAAEEAERRKVEAYRASARRRDADAAPLELLLGADPRADPLTAHVAGCSFDVQRPDALALL